MLHLTIKCTDCEAGLTLLEHTQDTEGKLPVILSPSIQTAKNRILLSVYFEGTETSETPVLQVHNATNLKQVILL